MKPDHEYPVRIDSGIWLYMAAGDVHLRPFALMPMGAEMSGVYTLRLTGEKRKEEIMGFGVALTGSSCYHLKDKETDTRRRIS